MCICQTRVYTIQVEEVACSERDTTQGMASTNKQWNKTAVHNLKLLHVKHAHQIVLDEQRQQCSSTKKPYMFSGNNAYRYKGQANDRHILPNSLFVEWRHDQHIILTCTTPCSMCTRTEDASA